MEPPEKWWKNDELAAAIYSAVEELATAADVTYRAERKLCRLLEQAGVTWTEPNIEDATKIALSVVRERRERQRRRAHVEAGRRIGRQRALARRA